MKGLILINTKEITLFTFEKNTPNVCKEHVDAWIIMGTGRDDGVGKKTRYYNAYYCPICKKVYYEDCDFAEPIRVFYSKKATRQYLLDAK